MDGPANNLAATAADPSASSESWAFSHFDLNRIRPSAVQPDTHDLGSGFDRTRDYTDEEIVAGISEPSDDETLVDDHADEPLSGVMLL